MIFPSAEMWIAAVLTLEKNVDQPGRNPEANGRRTAIARLIGCHRRGRIPRPLPSSLPALRPDLPSHLGADPTRPRNCLRPGSKVKAQPINFNEMPRPSPNETTAQIPAKVKIKQSSRAGIIPECLVPAFLEIWDEQVEKTIDKIYD